MPDARRSVLVVEDEEPFQEILARTFAPFGFDLRKAYSNGQARAVLAAGVPLSGAIIDVQLPDGSGFEFLAELRKVYPRLPIAVCTAHLDRSLVNTAARYSARYVCKDGKEELAAFAREIISHPPGGNGALAEAVAAFAKKYKLSPRERQVLEGRAFEKLSKEIADELRVSPKTIKTHVAHILIKCGRGSLEDVARELRAQARLG